MKRGWMLLLMLSLVGCGGNESPKGIPKAPPKAKKAKSSKQVLQLAAKAPLNDLVASEEKGKHYLVLFRNGKTHRLSAQGYDELTCEHNAKGEMCWVRNGTKCGIIHRRTGKVLEPLTHTCKPKSYGSWLPCEGQCMRFADGARFQFVNGAFKKAPAATPKPTKAAEATSNPKAGGACDKDKIRKVSASDFKKAMKAKDWLRYAALIQDAFKYQWCQSGGKHSKGDDYAPINKLAQKGGLNRLKIPVRITEKFGSLIKTTKFLSGCKIGEIGALGPNIYCPLKVRVKEGAGHASPYCDSPQTKEDPKAFYMGPIWSIGRKESGTFTVYLGVLNCLTTQSKGLVIKGRK